MQNRIRTFAVAIAAVLLASTAHAQSGGSVDTIVVSRPTVIVPADDRPTPPAHRNLVFVQPLSAMFEVYAAEYERALSPRWTLGLGANFWSPEVDEVGLDYLSTDLKARYYPGGRALQGFALGGSVGVTRIAAHDADDEGSTSGASIGTSLEYGWLLGASRDFHVGLGLGAKSLFVGRKSFSHDVTLHYPTARVSVGWAF